MAQAYDTGKVRKTASLALLAFCAMVCICCSRRDLPVKATALEKAKPDVEGVRIAWDYSTLLRVSSPETGARYNGYARMVQLHDGSLACVYEADGSVVVVKSTNYGASWSTPVTVAARQDGINMAVPDILELEDASILVCYNPRPYKIEPARKFAIRTKKSYDGGKTWQDERLLYEAGHEFENGCWEPAAIQLPSGEIQLFFANEGPYTASSEQNISLLRSHDKGLTWSSTPAIASFRAGKRDGMPSPLLLQNGKEIVFAMEDNGTGNFKPYIIRNTVAENWESTVDAKSSNRSHALTDSVGTHIYAGAPYLRQLAGGETVLSYQGTESRINKIGNAEMKVVIGDSEARNFDRKTVPFAIPADKAGLWNSLCVLKDNTVVALTSTNAHSEGGQTEVWMIKGYVIPAILPSAASVNVNEPYSLEQFPLFIGHRSQTRVRGQVSYDQNFLYVRTKVTDAAVSTDTEKEEVKDGITVFLNTQQHAYISPGKGVYSITLSADNKLLVRQGEEGQWVKGGKGKDIRHTSKVTPTGYVQEIRVSWSAVGGKPAPGKGMGFTMRLHEATGKDSSGYQESISATDVNQPSTWMRLSLSK